MTQGETRIVTATNAKRPADNRWIVDAKRGQLRGMEWPRSRPLFQCGLQWELCLAAYQGQR